MLDLAADRDEDRLVALDAADDVLARDVGRGDDDDLRSSRRSGRGRGRRRWRARRSSGWSRRTRPRARRCRRCRGPCRSAWPVPRDAAARPDGRVRAGRAGRDDERVRGLGRDRHGLATIPPRNPRDGRPAARPPASPTGPQRTARAVRRRTAKAVPKGLRWFPSEPSGPYHPAPSSRISRDHRLSSGNHRSWTSTQTCCCRSCSSRSSSTRPCIVGLDVRRPVERGDARSPTAEPRSAAVDQTLADVVRRRPRGRRRGRAGRPNRDPRRRRADPADVRRRRSKRQPSHPPDPCVRPRRRSEPIVSDPTPPTEDGRDALTGLLDAAPSPARRDRGRPRRPLSPTGDDRRLRAGRPRPPRRAPRARRRPTGSLPAVADTIRRLARGADTSHASVRARFGVLLPETDEVAAINYVERVRRACELWLESGAMAMQPGHRLGRHEPGTRRWPTRSASRSSGCTRSCAGSLGGRSAPSPSPMRAGVGADDRDLRRRSSPSTWPRRDRRERTPARRSPRRVRPARQSTPRRIPRPGVAPVCSPAVDHERAVDHDVRRCRSGTGAARRRSRCCGRSRGRTRRGRR